MLGRGHKQWIEVNLAGGVDLPGDIDELDVDPGELATAVGMRGGPTADADVTGALNTTFGNKLRYL